ncbi:M15 family metallopeptidase [Promicromonospora sp. MS192]|uniref:M15 family metallopeptidase n=1 Tax=Promicromonospora sp. MS192 TaxID=3412684 RepID=UPI003C30128F
MRHGQERSLPQSSAPRPAAARRTRGRHSKGRHAAPARRPRTSMLGRLPLTLGVGLALASTTSFTAASFGAPGTGEPLLSAPDGAAALTGAGPASAALADRSSGASRSQERTSLERSAGVTVPGDAVLPVEKSAPVQVEAPPVLPGCDGVATGEGLNGQLPVSELCDLWDGYPPIRADAAVALARLNQAYTEQFGESLCLTDGYRSYAQQVAAKAAKPTLTATPGTSNHGWGLAVDICADGYAGERWDWLKAHAPEYGWDNPLWAQAGGAGPYEPWHWEFTAAVTDAAR